MAKRAIYYDTETTGVRPDKDRIIEIAAFDPELDRRFEMLVNPQIPIPKDATKIHGITDEMVSAAPTFVEVGAEFTKFCEGEVVLIAHNNDQFDKHFLSHEYKRHDLELPDWNMVDSLKWARKYRPDLPRHSLQFLRKIYDIQENNAHRAFDDVIVLHQVFSFMIDDLDMETVLSLMNDTSPSVMPFGKHQGKALSEIPDHYLKWLVNEGAFEKPENLSLKQAFEKIGKLKPV